jgi:L-lysine 6-transaminase
MADRKSQKTDVLEANRTNQRNAFSRVVPQDVVSELEKHVLIDGFQIVVDLRNSRGSWLVDAASGRKLLDLYGFFGSMALGYNHPYLSQPQVQADLLEAARVKVANPDVYSTHLARFVKAFNRVMGLPELERYFFIEGGAAAVENALKAAMDWKVRKNLAAGRGERGTQILHFERAFHGRSGYTLSLTNTDPRKTEYFAKFNWPRVAAPSIDASRPEPDRTRDAIGKERRAEARIREIVERDGQDIAAMIIEPIQGEGGDNHFRGEWLRTLRQICDTNDILLIFDEVQTGFGTTGRRWCFEHFEVLPDLLAFGKKAQVCGVMAGPRLDDVPENVFRLSGRINSTWGGNLADMVRSTQYLEVIEREKLIAHAETVGLEFLEQLRRLAVGEPLLSGVRGRGFMLAFDLPNRELRETFYKGLFEIGLLAIRSGERSIRFRPALDFPSDSIRHAIAMLTEQCRRMRAQSSDLAATVQTEEIPG